MYNIIMLRHYFTVGVHGPITRLNWLMLMLRDMHSNMDRVDLTDCIHEYRPCRLIYMYSLP